MAEDCCDFIATYRQINVTLLNLMFTSLDVKYIYGSSVIQGFFPHKSTVYTLDIDLFQKRWVEETTTKPI